MKFLVQLLVVCFLACCSPPSASIGSPPAGMPMALRAIQISSTPNQLRQIADAVRASPELAAQLERLVAAGRLTAIIVQSAPMRPFGARVDGLRMIFSADFLKAQKTNRLFDVVFQDDILPNNTVFALGHLAYHLGAPPISRANPEAYLVRKLVEEAYAFVQGWNDVVDAATRQNGGHQLSGRQATQLLMNMRYRFAFLTAVLQKTHKLELSADGRVDTNSNNMSAIATALANSQIADIE